MDIFTVSQLWQLILSAALTSIVVSAITTVWTDLQGTKSLVMVAIVAFVITVLRTTFISTSQLATAMEKIAYIQSVALGMLITWAFALLFWKFFGKRFVDVFFTGVWKAIQQKIGSPDPTPPTNGPTQ